MIVAVPPPGGKPVTSPVPEVTDTLVLRLLHVPVAGVLLRVVVAPTQTPSVPVMALGSAFTVAVNVREQPVGNVYTRDTVPGAIPQREPEEVTVATAGVPLLHVPPEGSPEIVMHELTHTSGDAGETPVGIGSTAIVRVR